MSFYGLYATECTRSCHRLLIAGPLKVPYKYMLQVGFEPGTYGILSTWIWDSTSDHSATIAEYSIYSEMLKGPRSTKKDTFYYMLAVNATLLFQCLAWKTVSGDFSGPVKVA